MEMLARRGAVIERNAAIIAIKECNGPHADTIASAVIQHLAQDSGRFAVWITPGTRDHATEVRIENDRGDSWSFGFFRGHNLQVDTRAR
jgi:hypothetical protein